MDYFKECGVIESISAELVGSFTMCSILLSGSTLKPFRVESNLQTQENKTQHDQHFMNKMSISGAKTLEYAVAHGLIVASVVAITVHISGGHLNPAVTLGALICRYIRVIPAICYVVAQTVGALLGEVAARLIIKKPDKEVSELDVRTVFVHGVLSSFILVSVFLSVFDPKKIRRDIGSGALVIGLTETMILCAVMDNRRTVNPAMSLVISMHHTDFVQHWLFWVAPLVGGLLAGLVYRALTNYPSSSFVHVHRSAPLVIITTSNS